MNGIQFRHYDDAIFLKYPHCLTYKLSHGTMKTFFTDVALYFAVIFKNINNLVLGSQDTF